MVPASSTPTEFAWSARDNVNYNETGILASLDFAAKNAKELLRNFHTKSLNSWQKGLKEPPYAFLIPEDQGDPARVAQLVARLLAQHIEVWHASAAIHLKDGESRQEPTWCG